MTGNQLKHSRINYVKFQTPEGAHGDCRHLGSHHFVRLLGQLAGGSAGQPQSWAACFCPCFPGLPPLLFFFFMRTSDSGSTR